MSAPTWEHYLAPTLLALQDGTIRHRRDIFAAAAEALQLTDEQRAITPMPFG